MLKIAKYFNSLQFVVICIVCIQITLIIDTATLLYTSFPTDMWWFTKLTSSCIGAITLEAFLLVISVNTYLFSNKAKIVPFAMGVSCTLMTLFFLEAFSSPSYEVMYKRAFVSVLFGFINYMLGELFTKKWSEFTELINDKEHITKLHQEFTNTKEKLHDSQVELTNIEKKLSSTEKQLSFTQQELIEVESKFNLKTVELNNEITALTEQLVQSRKKLSRSRETVLK